MLLFGLTARDVRLLGILGGKKNAGDRIRRHSMGTHVGEIEQCPNAG